MKNPITPDFYEFFIGLAANNHKTWFDEHRAEYEKHVKIPFETLVGDLLQSMAKENEAFGALKPGNCIFRINRDIRFAKDKTPYKLNRSALISLSGKKDMGPGGFYFELGPEICAFYAGSYMPEKDELEKIRTHIAENAAKWDGIVNDKAFKKLFGSVLGEKVKKAPAGFADKVAELPVLLNKQFYIKHEFSPEESMETNLPEFLLKLRKTAAAYTNFLTDAISAQY
jgi:uncharacterized protein (TIGR02453 family)